MELTGKYYKYQSDINAPTIKKYLAIRDQKQKEYDEFMATNYEPYRITVENIDDGKMMIELFENILESEFVDKVAALKTTGYIRELDTQYLRDEKKQRCYDMRECMQNCYRKSVNECLIDWNAFKEKYDRVHSILKMKLFEEMQEEAYRTSGRQLTMGVFEFTCSE
jgi:hypothetical protein